MMMREQSWTQSPDLNPTLLPQHLDYLKVRGVSEEMAKKARLFSASKAQVALYLGRKFVQSAGMVIPYPIRDNAVEVRVRFDVPLVRPDGKEQRWGTPGGMGVRPYIPPWITKEQWADFSLPIAFLEAPVKAMSVNEQLGMLAIGLAGVDTGHDSPLYHETGIEQLHPELLEMGIWEGRTVYIIFDSNRETKTSVRSAERRLARCLEKAGAQVFIVELPHNDKETDPKKKEWGPDDFIAAKGKDALSLLIETARPAKEVHQPIAEINDKLRRNKQNVPNGSIYNASLILHLDPRWEGILAYNLFSERVVVTRTPPWDREYSPKETVAPESTWQDEDDSRLSAWLEKNWGLKIKPETCKAVVELISRQSPYHPVRQYLHGLVWDGQNRLDTWLNVYFGAESKAYTSAVGVKFLLSMVARVMRPGCKADCLPIFEGDQGAKKSQAMKILCKGWFTDQISDITNKDAAIDLQGVWGIELAEFDYMLKYESAALKRFFSREFDRFRSPYGRRSELHLRQCIFMGTTNADNYLKDETGGRRYWPIRIYAIDLELLQQDLDQLWAEAVARYQAGEKWWLDGDLAKLAKQEQDDRYMADPWEDTIAAYLADETARAEKDKKDVFVLVADVLDKVLHKEVGLWNSLDKIRVSSVLKRLGFVAKRQSTGLRLWGFAPKTPLVASSAPVEEGPSVQAVQASLIESEKIQEQKEKGLTLPLQTAWTVDEAADPLEEGPARSAEEAKELALQAKSPGLSYFAERKQVSIFNRVCVYIEQGMNPDTAWRKAISIAYEDLRRDNEENNNF